MVEAGSMFADRFLLRERIGGNASRVWRADDGRQTVAVKVLPGHVDPDTVARFLAEASALNGLNHPAVVPVVDYGLAGTDPYLVMPYVVGEPLGALLRRGGGLDAARAMELVADVAEALHAAAAAGVGHTDLSAADVILRLDGTPVVTGFGGVPDAAGLMRVLGLLATACLRGGPIADDEPDALDVPAPVRSVVDGALSDDATHLWPDLLALAAAARQSVDGPAVRRPAPTPLAPPLPVEPVTEPLPVLRASTVAPPAQTLRLPRRWTVRGRPTVVALLVLSVVFAGYAGASMLGLSSWPTPHETTTEAAPTTTVARTPTISPTGTPTPATTIGTAAPTTPAPTSESPPPPATSADVPPAGGGGGNPAPPPPPPPPGPSTFRYQLTAGTLGSLAIDGDCIFRVWFFNYGSVPVAKFRAFGGNCGSPTIGVAAQRGDVMTYQSDQPGVTGGTDECGTYIEIQVIAAGDPAYAVGMRITFPQTGNTYIYHHVDGGAQPVYRSC